jgi:hypothetical protein
LGSSGSCLTRCSQAVIDIALYENCQTNYICIHRGIRYPPPPMDVSLSCHAFLLALLVLPMSSISSDRDRLPDVLEIAEQSVCCDA